LEAEGFGRVAVFDVHTGKVQYPACWQEIATYYHYLIGRGCTSEAQRLLAESIADNKPVACGMERMNLCAA
jgi:hypothetical protein